MVNGVSIAASPKVHNESRSILTLRRLQILLTRSKDIPFLESKTSKTTAANPSLFQYQWNLDDRIVVISDDVRPRGTFSSLKPAARKQALSNFLQKSLASIGAQKIYEKDISTTLAVSREIKVKRIEDYVIARTHIVGDIYVSISVAIAGSSTESDVMKLFDALEFLK